MAATLRQAVARVPGWAWLTLASLLVTPLYLKYFAWVLGGCVGFVAPLH